MYIKEFGDRLKKTVILLHGGGLSWWSYRRLITLIENDYHIVLPVLDGHAGSDRPFTSIEDNARELVDYIDGQYGGHVFLIGGLSLGGQILLDMISIREDICSFAIVESALVIPMRVTGSLIDTAVRMSYPLISQKWFAKMQFRYLRLPDELFEDYFRDTAKITRLDMTAFMKANTSYTLKDPVRQAKGKVLISAGGKELLRMKRSAKLIHKAIKNSSLDIIPGYVHGELSISHPDRYAELMKELTG